MLSKDKRLNLRKDFKWVASGKRLETPYSTIFYRFGQNVSPKVGIAVSSKVFKEAYQRNRARRLVSSALELLYPRLISSLNIIALPKTSVFDVKSTNISQNFERALSKNSLLI